MFTLDAWPNQDARVPNVHWYPCNTCGDWFFRVVFTNDPDDNLTRILALCWLEADECEVCDYTRKRDAAKEKHPAFWQRKGGAK